MLLTVLVEAVTSGNRSAKFVEIFAPLRSPFRFFTSAVAAVQLLDELGVRFVAVLTLGVGLRTLLLSFVLVHGFDLAVESNGTVDRRPG